MTNILGPYYAPHHHWQHDRDYVRALDPAWNRIHQPDALAIHEMTECAPNANIMLRSWDIDDHNGDRKREMYADPKGAAQKHLEMWIDKCHEIVIELQRNRWSFDESKWYWGLVNEPDPKYVPQVVEYTAEAMRLVQGTSYRLGVVCSSVGTFSKPSENGDGWTKFIPLEKPINDGGHILIVHEYWQPEGPTFTWYQDGVAKHDAGNLAWRHRSIPLNVPILIGESGANGYIYGRHTKEDNGGWRKYMQPEQYAAQVKEYIELCDQRIKGVLLYMLDYHSDQWESFYTGPAAQQLLAIKDVRPQVANPFAASTPPVTVHLPSIGAGPSVPQEVRPMTGVIDPRVAQAIMRIESGGRTHGENGKPIIRFEAHIFRSKLGNDALWHEHFRTDALRAWTNQERRLANGEWVAIHTGSQADEYAAFEQARAINEEAAYQSISVGAPQIMGFNHARIGYPSAKAMFQSFGNGPMQTFGFTNFILSDPGLFDAVRRKDWREIARRYNGSGAVDTYAPLLEKAYNDV